MFSLHFLQRNGQRRDIGERAILLGSDITEVAYMDVDWARRLGGSPATPDWHDVAGAVVRNNLVVGAAGAGVALYGARDVMVVHNTLLQVASVMQVRRRNAPLSRLVRSLFHVAAARAVGPKEYGKT